MKKLKVRAEQKTTINWFIGNPSSGLFMDPGKGKTVSTLTALAILKRQGKLKKSTLIVAPKFVCMTTWPDEVREWSHVQNMTTVFLHGKNKKQLWTAKPDIFLINPEGLPWLHDELLDGMQDGKCNPFECLWIDEVTKFKNPKSGRFELLKNMLPLFARVHTMTGTPMPSNYLELWSQVYLLDRGGALGESFYKFRRTHFYKQSWDDFTWHLKDGHDTIIIDKIKHLFLSIPSTKATRDEKPLHVNIKVELPPKARKIYNLVWKDYLNKKDKETWSEDYLNIVPESAAESFMKCHQISNGRIYYYEPDDDERVNQLVEKIHSEKVTALCNLIDELNGKPLLVAFYFKHDIQAIEEKLGEVPFINSQTNTKKAAEYLRKWNKGELKYLFAHPTSMAHGLNLHKGGHHICWFSMTPSLENWLQFNARLRWELNENRVVIHRIITSNTVDETMLERLKTRNSNQKLLKTNLQL